NGTWMQLTGVKDGDTVRWSFTHLEPYLRRTYKGTTAEMKQTVQDALAGKKEPPAPDEKEMPGFGPEVPREEEKKGGGCAADPAADEETTQMAVIPTVLVGGPLAMLAMLFPSLFGGWKRWLALISVACTNSTIFFVHDWFATDLAGTWWG